MEGQEQEKNLPRSPMVERDAIRNARMMKVNWLLISATGILAILALITGKQDHVTIFLIALTITFGHSYILFTFTAVVGEARHKEMDDEEYLAFQKKIYDSHYCR